MIQTSPVGFPVSGPPPEHMPALLWEVRCWVTARSEWETVARTLYRSHAVSAARTFVKEEGGDYPFAEVWGPGRGTAFGDQVVFDRLTAGE